MDADSTRLKRTIEDLLKHQSNDERLRDHLEGIRRDLALPGLTWFWGPELYRRNRVVFREFILAHFSDTERAGAWQWRRTPWKRYADRLQSWLEEARRNRDVMLVRRLLRWKFAKEPWGIDDDAWCRELRQCYQAAKTPATEGIVLDEFDDWFQLDEATALALYSTNRACSKFLLKHLPTRYSFWGHEKREPWRQIIDAALDAGDEELAFALYRRQIDVAEWQRDIEKLAGKISDADRLNDELAKRHPEGWGLKLGDGILSLLRRCGRDVLPYVRSKLESIVGGWYASEPEPFLAMARERGWWDLWAAVVRTTSNPKVFNVEVARVLDDVQLRDDQRVERLRALAGVSQEWNWSGIGFARVHSLEDRLAVLLYQRYPKLVRGPFKPNIVPTWWQGGPELLKAAQAAADDELVDLLASRYVTRVGYGFGGEQHNLGIAQDLAVAFQTMRERDESLFARRAANILTQVPAFSIFHYDQLLRTNGLARLLFVRSFPAYLSVPDAVRDLIEGSEVHVQMLAYRVLAQDDERARKIAVESMEILLGTLLRPLHRKTRLAAFGALANAATSDCATATKILRRARDAMRLPDKKYPKEQLVGLIGQILHAWPDLRGPRERPVIYGLQEAMT
ncbi:MAG TPA: hypothetical protein VFE62_10850 [Gemmataceae bacterium]|nr:hypothetical protein [Gemmataceae bacterium]